MRCVVQPDVEKAHQREVVIQDSIENKRKIKLKKFIRDNSVCKKLKIIACSWEKSPDIPEHGYVDGDMNLSGNVAGGGILGVVSVGGKIKGKGKIRGEYTGRVCGNEYCYFHFILSDNSYHVIDVSKNKKWRMAKNGLIIRYEKIYTDYSKYTEKMDPLYNESRY